MNNGAFYWNVNNNAGNRNRNISSHLVNAKKGKGWYVEVKMVDENPEYYFGQLQQMLINHTYRTSEYKTFIKKDSGKEREIYKLPYFPDRICQWAILQVIEPILIRNLTNDIKETFDEISDMRFGSGITGTEIISIATNI